MKKYIAPIALLTLLIAFTSPAAPVELRYSATTPGPQLSIKTGKVTDSWRERHALLAKRAQAGGFDIMFLGDSITRQWESKGKEVWAQKLAPLGAKSFGVAGDRTENLLWHLQNGFLDGKSDPKLIVMLIGTNNTGHGMDKPADIAAGITACLDEIQKRKPAAKILVLAIFPRNEKPDDEKRLNNEAANKLIAKLADGKKVFFANINHLFLTKDGILEKSVMPDLLHLSPESYLRWADAVVPEIKKLM